MKAAKALKKTVSSDVVINTFAKLMAVGYEGGAVSVGHLLQGLGNVSLALTGEYTALHNEVIQRRDVLMAEKKREIILTDREKMAVDRQSDDPELA